MKRSHGTIQLFQIVWLLLSFCSCHSFSVQGKHVVRRSLDSTLRCSDVEHYENDSTRRSFTVHVMSTMISSGAISTVFPSLVQAEDDNDSSSSSSFKRVNAKLGFAYEFTPPSSVMTTSNKPLQTHLDEINLPTNRKGYTYGVTVDPIRIQSLKDFGTPSEVAAKIVMAELRRDGVLDVTLARDAREDIGSGAYDVEYISDGTRGKKHFVTRSIVKDGKLFVLTVQVKEDDWKDVENEVLDAVHSFRALDKKAYQ